MDFTLSKYKEILLTLKNYKYDFYTMEDWFVNNANKGVVIRHDVDRRAKNSLKKAEIENSLNIRSTYYFRIKKCSFKLKVIKEILSFGHEIGYHYEDLSNASNNINNALADFGKNLSYFRTICDVKTIAMHGTPISNIDNRKLFNGKELINYGLLGDAYLSIDYSDKYYFSDTGRSWTNKSRTNFRDYVDCIQVENVKCSNDLIKFIQTEKPKIIFLMTHPERWNNNLFSYSLYYIRDMLTKSGKIIYSTIKEIIQN